MKRDVKVFYFECDTDIQSYILNLRNILDTQNSIEYRGNHIQLRDISQENNYILGRLCKVREVEKPTVGSAYDTNEELLEKDIIESAHFIYNSSNQEIIIQHNTNVSTDPNSLLSKLLVKTHMPELESGLGIPAILRDDALTEIIGNRGSIKQVKVITTQQGANFIARETGDDVEMGDGFLEGIAYKERTLSYKVNIGGVQESFIRKMFIHFQNRKIEDAAFTIDGNRSAIKLSEFAKYKTLNIEVNDGGSLDTEDFKVELLRLVSDE